MGNIVFEFPYGTTRLKASIPEKNIEFVLESTQSERITNYQEELLCSLRSPIGSLPLIDRINKSDKVVIMVTDNTRSCPDDVILPPLLNELEQKIPRANISIIVALGTHPPLTKEQLTSKLGKDIVEKYNIVNHDINQVMFLGTTSRGTPVYINKRVIEADFRISTGFIEPHYFAGFSGGGKSIAPGVSNQESICKNHSYQMIAHPYSRVGMTRGNPIREDIDEQAEMAQLNFIVNVLLNSKKEITHIVAGDPFIAHKQGCEILKSVAGVKVDHKVDITITTNGGYPLDLDLYQSTKGIDNAAAITSDGGIIIMAALCSEGVGPDEFRAVHSSVSSPKLVLQKIKREEPIKAQWANQILARSQLKNDIYLISNLNDSIVNDMMLIPVRTIENGLKRAFEVLGNSAKIAVIAEGPTVFPAFDM